ncbi:hypothetical protein [Amycolatopsis acidicola]|nr:hypothetical protein [Amycolatopsis acidicola]
MTLRLRQTVPRPDTPMDRLTTAAAAFDGDVFRGLLELLSA